MGELRRERRRRFMFGMKEADNAKENAGR
jgi:hypothetical protein